MFENIATNVWTQSKNHETAEALIVAYEAYWDACDRHMCLLNSYD